MDLPLPLLGEPLRDAREAAGLTQDQLATLAGVSRGTVQNMEYGRTPSLRNSRLVRAALDRVANTPVPDRVALLEQKLEDLESRVNEIATQGAA